MVRNAVRISQQNMERSYAVKFFLVLLSCFACVALSGVEARAQSCTYIPFSGSESIEAGITNAATGEVVGEGAVVPSGTKLRFDSVATADGYCVCKETGMTYFRTVNHTTVWADIFAGALDGRYTLGYVWGKSPGGTTAFWHVLDTTATNSTGPVYHTPFERGSYTFYIRAVINATPCRIKPDRTETKTISITVV